MSWGNDLDKHLLLFQDHHDVHQLNGFWQNQIPSSINLKNSDKEDSIFVGYYSKLDDGYING